MLLLPAFDNDDDVLPPSVPEAAQNASGGLFDWVTSGDGLAVMVLVGIMCVVVRYLAQSISHVEHDADQRPAGDASARHRVDQKYRTAAFGHEPFGWRFWLGWGAMFALPTAVMIVMVVARLSATRYDQVSVGGTSEFVMVTYADWHDFWIGMILLTPWAVLTVRIVVRERQVARQRLAQPNLRADRGANLIVPFDPYIAAYVEDGDAEVD